MPTIAELNDVAWADFMAYAIGKPELRAAYTTETGRKFMPPPQSGLDAMIDNATGVTGRESLDFAVWATVRLWGLSYCPAKFRDLVLKMKSSNELPWMTDGDIDPAPE